MPRKQKSLAAYLMKAKPPKISSISLAPPRRQSLTAGAA